MKLLLLAATLAFLGACSSGAGCDGGGGEKKTSNGESAGLPGGPSSHGTGEAVSFQGLGKKTAGQPAPTGSAAKTAAAASALGGSNAPAPDAAGAQTVICGGFPYVAADCKTDPVYPQILKKCCPSGTVDKCQAIPGGARLIGQGCTAPADGPAK
jgi:hypothetical protein